MCNHQVGKIKKEICYDCSNAYLCYNINSVAHFDSSQSSTVWMALATCMSVKNHQKKVKNKSSKVPCVLDPHEKQAAVLNGIS